MSLHSEKLKRNDYGNLISNYVYRDYKFIWPKSFVFTVNNITKQYKKTKSSFFLIILVLCIKMFEYMFGCKYTM